MRRVMFEGEIFYDVDKVIKRIWRSIRQHNRMIREYTSEGAYLPASLLAWRAKSLYEQLDALIELMHWIKVNVVHPPIAYIYYEDPVVLTRRPSLYVIPSYPIPDRWREDPLIDIIGYVVEIRIERRRGGGE